VAFRACTRLSRGFCVICIECTHFNTYQALEIVAFRKNKVFTSYV